MSGMEPERIEADGPLAGYGSQGGARGTGGQHQEQQREQEVPHQQEHWGAALTKEASRTKNRLALERAKKIAYIRGNSQEGSTGADKEIVLSEVCHKQYEKAMEFEQHLSSYDHHHKKRLQEMRMMQNERTRDERAKKEAKAMNKEMAKLQQQ
eukprot:1154194-Pelagomonas_calceolata.AAC.2